MKILQMTSPVEQVVRKLQPVKATGKVLQMKVRAFEMPVRRAA